MTGIQKRLVFSAMSLLLYLGLSLTAFGQAGKSLYSSDLKSGNAIPSGVVETLPAPGAKCNDVTWDGFNLWVTDDQTRKIYKLDSVGGVLESFPFPETRLYCQGITFDGNFLWVCCWDSPNGEGSELFKMNKITGAVESSVSYPGAYNANWPMGMSYAGSVMWVNNAKTMTLDRINPGTGELLGTLPAPSANTAGVSWGLNALWATDVATSRIDKLDRYTGAVLGHINMPAANCRGMEWDGNYLWTVAPDEKTIYKMTVGSLGLEEIPGEDITIYPNPGKGIFRLQMKNPPPYPLSIIITDLSGKEVFQMDAHELKGGDHTVALNLEALPPGYYIATIRSGKKIIEKKLVITR